LHHCNIAVADLREIPKQKVASQAVAGIIEMSLQIMPLQIFVIEVPLIRAVRGRAAFQPRIDGLYQALI